MSITLAEAEALLFHEAALLDSWRLLEWAALFTADAEYHVPSPDDPDGVHGRSLYLIDDDRHRLEQRARRLLAPSAHSEVPRSRSCRVVSNVRILEGDVVESVFVLYRSKGERLDIYPGHARHELERDAAGAWRIRRKRAVLGLADLRLQGKLSLIV